MASKKKRPARTPPPPPPPPDAPAPEPEPSAPARGMTTEQIRRVNTRIAEHEKDLKGSTSRR